MSPYECSHLASATSKLRHEEITSNLGSRVLASKKELLSGRLGLAIRCLLTKRGALVFPEIHLSADEQIAFSKTLGTSPASAELVLDDSRSALPIFASRLFSKKLPSWSNNTGFCETHATFSHLPEKQDARLERLRVMHSAWASLFYREPKPNAAKLRTTQSLHERDLPLVRKRRTGRNSTALGCTTQHFIDLDAMQSSQILVELREWATDEQFSYTHNWHVGDLVMWADTATIR